MNGWARGRLFFFFSFLRAFQKVIHWLLVVLLNLFIHFCSLYLHLISFWKIPGIIIEIGRVKVKMSSGRTGVHKMFKGTWQLDDNPPQPTSLGFLSTLLSYFILKFIHRIHFCTYGCCVIWFYYIKKKMF